MTSEEVLKKIVGQRIVSISSVTHDVENDLLDDDNADGIVITLENGVILDSLGEPLGFLDTEEAL